MKRSGFTRKAAKSVLSQRKCKMCGEWYRPVMPLQRACGPACAIDLGRFEQIKMADREARKKMQTLKTLPQLKNGCQAAFNKFIRLRDRELPCVSCLRYHDGQWQAGHYRSRGACPALRYNEFNTWKQCAPCNNHLSGNIVPYRKELIRRIGIEKVEWLEGHHEPQHYTREQLIEMTKIYRQKARDLEKLNHDS